MPAQNLRIPGPVAMPEAVRAALANQMINHRGAEFDEERDGDARSGDAPDA